MPIRWDAATDHLLLTLILKQYDISVDGKLIVDAWPVEEGKEKPTPRAITERVYKIRHQGGNSAPARTPASAIPKQASKRGATKTGAKKTTTKSTGPRKRKATSVLPTTESSDGEDDQGETLDDENEYIPNKRRSIIKQEIHQDMDQALPLSPAATPSSQSHRQSRARSTTFIGSYQDDEADGGNAYDDLNDEEAHVDTASKSHPTNTGGSGFYGSYAGFGAPLSSSLG